MASRQIYNSHFQADCSVSLPSLLPAVRAGLADCPAPFDPSMGGDLLPAVKAMIAVVVAVLNVLGHQLKAIGAAGHRGGVVDVDREPVLSTTQRTVARPVVDDIGHASSRSSNLLKYTGVSSKLRPECPQGGSAYRPSLSILRETQGDSPANFIRRCVICDFLRQKG